MLASSLAIIVLSVNFLLIALLVGGRRGLDVRELILVWLADVRKRLLGSRDDGLHLSNWRLVLIVVVHGGNIMPDGAGSGLALNQGLNLTPLRSIRIFNLFLLIIVLVESHL